MQINKRIAITGMGAVTPLGSNLDATWEGLLAGRSGIGPVTRFDAEGLPCRIAGEVPPLNLLPGMSSKLLRGLDSFALFALAACEEAVLQSGLEVSVRERERTGVVIGSSRGGIGTLESNFQNYGERGYHSLSPRLTVSSLINQAPSAIAQRYQLTGPALAVSTACSSGAHAVVEAARMIKTDEVDVVLTGGAEAPVTRIILGGFARARALSRRNEDPENACRPFDRHREGFVIAEGAGILVLERWGHAEARGAAILGELVGCGTATDPHHMTAPDPTGEGMVRAMRAALRAAGIGPDEVDLVNAHGTGTALNDRVEAKALRRVFGPGIERLPVCAVKSMTGHMLGASGAVELIVSLLSARIGQVPPIRNLDDPDPDCRLNFVRGRPLRGRFSTVVSNSFAFGGANVVLLVRCSGKS
ncbi:MAG: beta-ketoacyl-[acyl-carrier-protein] synthase family protein [Deltaproteobacteria bacterium]|nr:beta-ketoacyl-[acyl-carrier-protein] synthase family protein [Deltaproteobacteria bacterium]